MDRIVTWMEERKLCILQDICDDLVEGWIVLDTTVRTCCGVEINHSDQMCPGCGTTNPLVKAGMA